jgi:putative alpha-1,2-mannosidase
MGAPLFKRAVLHLENGEDFVIEAKNNSAENRYIESAKLHGKRFSRNYITFDEVMRGGKLSFKMSPTPNLERGTADKDLPYSFSREAKQ